MRPLVRCRRTARSRAENVRYPNCRRDKNLSSNVVITHASLPLLHFPLLRFKKRQHAKKNTATRQEKYGYSESRSTNVRTPPRAILTFRWAMMYAKTAIIKETANQNRKKQARRLSRPSPHNTLWQTRRRVPNNLSRAGWAIFK